MFNWANDFYAFDLSKTKEMNMSQIKSWIKFR